jgi:pilus assembly protein Flp/PilA
VPAPISERGTALACNFCGNRRFCNLTIAWRKSGIVQQLRAYDAEFTAFMKGSSGEIKMLTVSYLIRLYFGIKNFFVREEAQDLVEYALVVALIAFGAVTAMKGLSSEIKTAFSTISSDLGSSL